MSKFGGNRNKGLLFLLSAISLSAILAVLLQHRTDGFDLSFKKQFDSLPLRPLSPTSEPSTHLSNLGRPETSETEKGNQEHNKTVSNQENIKIDDSNSAGIMHDIFNPGSAEFSETKGTNVGQQDSEKDLSKIAMKLTQDLNEKIINLNYACRQLYSYMLDEARRKIDGEEQKKAELTRESFQNLTGTDLKTSNRSIVVLTAMTSDYKENFPKITERMLQNRNSYARKHGYHHMVIDLDKYNLKNRTAPKSWLKVFAIEEALNAHDNAQWVLWLDVDAIITNYEIDLIPHILDPQTLKRRIMYNAPLAEPGDMFKGTFYLKEERIEIDNVDLLLAQDNNMINTGVMLVKRSDFILKELIPKWTSEELMDRKVGRGEQGSLLWLMLNDIRIQERVGLVPQFILNSYTDGYSISSGRWRPGDFIIHFAGLSRNSDYEEHWERYWRLTQGQGKDRLGDE